MTMWRRRLVPMALVLIGALGWAADAAAQRVNVRVQDRTPGRAADTNFFQGQTGRLFAGSTGSTFTVNVPATTTAVQLRGQAPSFYGIRWRSGTSGAWHVQNEQDFNLNSGRRSVFQMNVRQFVIGSGFQDRGTSTIIILKPVGLNVGSVSGSASEARGTATFGVALRSQPSSAVTVSVTSQDPGEGTVSPSAMTFSTGDWNTAQTVTATGVDDNVDDGDVTWQVRLVPASSDAAYNDASSAEDVNVTTTDDEPTPSSALALSPASVTENGGIATVTATLSHPSSVAVTMTVSTAAGTGAVAADFALSTATTLTVAAGATVSIGLVTVTANDNNVYSPDKSVRVTGAVTPSDRAGNPSDATLTITEDEPPPTGALALSPASVTENGGISTVTAKLSLPAAAATTVTVIAAPVASTGAVQADFTQSGLTLTIAAGATVSAGLVTVTAVDNSASEGNKQVQLTALAFSGNAQVTLSTPTLVILEDDFVLDVGAVSGQATEAGGTATFGVRLRTQPSAAVTVSVTSRDTGEGTVSPSTMTFAPGDWNTAQTVTVTGVDDSIDDGTVTWAVRLVPASGDGNYDNVADVDVDVTTTDDDGAPGVTLSLAPSSIAESGTGNVATVSARLSRASGAATTVTVAAVAGAYTVGSDATIVIAAGATTAPSDTATVEAVDNDTDAPDRTATVTATVANDRAAADSTTMAVTGATLTVTDDDDAPTAALTLSPVSILENGGISTVTAALSHPSSQPSTVTVAAVAGAYTVGSDATIVIAAGATTAPSDTATVVGVDNAMDAPHRSVEVTATLTNGQGAGTVSAATLMLIDDDVAPGAQTWAPSQTRWSITDLWGTVGVSSARLSAVTTRQTIRIFSPRFPSQDWRLLGVDACEWTAVTGAGATGTCHSVKQIGTPGRGALSLSFTPTAAMIANGGVVIRGTFSGVGMTMAQWIPFLLSAKQPILILSPASVSENGGVATVTAELSSVASAAVTVTVAAAAGTGAVASDFSLSTATTLTIAAGTTVSAGLVTVTGVDNDVDAPDKSVTVTGTAASGDSGVNAPSSATLTLTDDDAAPTATLAVAPASVSENGGVATVTATLSHESSEPSTVTVTSVSGAYTAGTDATIVIAAGSTTAASDTATVTAVDDSTHQGSAGRSVTVTAALGNGQGAGAVTGAALTLTDDETLPTVALALDPTSVSENGGVSTVKATLSGPSSAAATVTVAAAAVASTGAVAGDFALSTAATLTIAAGATTSAGVVTVTGVDNNVDAADKSVTVSGTSAGGNGVAAPSAVTLTLTNDDDATATLVLNPAAIAENGGTSTVTARLSNPATEAATLTVTTTAVSPAVSGDFTRAGNTLTIAANATTSTGLVTVTAVDNSVATGNKQVNVGATASGGRGLAAPAVVALTIRDDEFGLNVGAVTNQATEGGGQSTFTVALWSQPTAAVTVAVTSRDADGNLDESEGTVAPSSLIFLTTNWNAAQTVTVTGADDAVDDGTVTWTVRLAPSSGDTSYGALSPVDVPVTTTDDDTARATLVLTPASILENGEVSTVTATLSHATTEAVTLTVAAAAGTGAVAADFTLSSTTTLTLAAGETTSTGLVTVTANDNTVASADKSVTVSATASGGRGLASPSDATLTLRDDEATADVNGDGAVNANDGLLMYYAYTFETVFKLDNDLGQRVRGFLRTLRGPGSPAAADAGYKAMLQAAWDWRSAGATAGDVNGDGAISANDGLLMYYAYTFEAVFKLENDLGQRVRGFLRTLRSPTSSHPATDAGYKAMLQAAWGLR